MAAPGRATDCTDAFREGVAQFCEVHQAEIMAFVVLHFTADIRAMLAELIALRDVPKETP